MTNITLCKCENEYIYILKFFFTIYHKHQDNTTIALEK
jgi:hypothetical protein